MTAPSSDSRATLFRHRPGLDGLRGLSVVAVLAFHGGFGWAKGGYLGVSAFFTLSGFLIATLLLREKDVTGGVDLRGFWWRRARRLLPAGLLGLLLSVVYAAVWADSTEGLRHDVLASLGYVANWRFVFSERSYADLFADPSPVQHYWSLAVEEQFYLVFPLLVAGCAAVARRWFRAMFLTVLVTLSVASVAVSVALAGSGGRRDRVYYGTDARAVEILLGALAAVALLASSGRRRSPGASVWVTAAGFTGLAVMVGLWVTVDQGNDSLHPWFLVVHAVATVALIAAAVRTGPVADALAWTPLRALGRISYGLYVFHWPVFLTLSEDRIGWSAEPLFALRVAVTVALAAASYRWIEQPILRGAPRPASRTRPAVLVAAGLATVIVAAFAVPTTRTTGIDFRSAASALEAASSDRSPAVTATGAAEPLQVTVLGDSVALMAAFGIDEWGKVSSEIRVAGGATPLGCPLIQEGEFDYDGLQPVPEKCDWITTWPAMLRATSTDVAVVHIGTWDIAEKTLPGYRGTLQVGNPVLDEYLSDQLDAANRVLLDEVGSVIWLTLPRPATFAEIYDATSDERVDRFNELLRAAAARSTGQVQIVDLAEWIAIRGPDDRSLRPDGMHFGDESSIEAGRWLGPAVLHALAHPDVAVVGPGDVADAAP